MRHLDLFSGIGGFALAVDTVWHETNNEHIFVEWEAFPQAVLKKHWPDAEIHGDIRAFIADTKSARQRAKSALSGKGVQPQDGDKGVYILTGGFPCQPFSTAGRRKGTEDDRYLWPPMLEAITLFKPRWVIAENVRGLVTWNDGMVLETVCSDLEREGYEVWPLIIPAASVGAPHRRERVWVVANTKCKRVDGTWGIQRPGEDFGTMEETPENAQRADNCFQQDWPSVATRLCTVDDGLPNGLVRPRGWRNAALKAAGNAIVPQVAMEIMYAIKSVDNCA